jgi:signal peptidase I
MRDSSRISLTNIKDRFRKRKAGRTEKAAAAILSVLLISLLVFWIQPRYRFAVQTDYSVTFLVGMIDKGNHSPVKGEYFAFRFLSLPKEPRYGRNFVKRLGCVEGEYLENRGRQFYCNGEYLGTAKKFSREGMPLTAFEYTGIIPKGRYFAIGETPDSYDSRFWGFVRSEWVIGKVFKVI